MNIIRKSVPKDIANKIPQLKQVALSYMREKYPTVNFDNVGYIFSASYNRSRYFRNDSNITYSLPNVCISTRAKLYLYEKKSLGIKQTNLFVGSDVQIVCALIHELTHHAQYETEERVGNELDTTRNELDYLKRFHSNYYKQICC